jgi:hypothetical protein
MRIGRAEQSLVAHGIDAIAQRLPFAPRGFDDNDGAFMNETLQAYWGTP